MNWKRTALISPPWGLHADSDQWPAYVLKVALLSAAAAGAVHNLASWVGVTLLGLDAALPIERGRDLEAWLAVVVMGPLLESGLVYLACRFAYSNFRGHEVRAAVTIGGVAGLLHAVVSPMWFFGPAISFFIWSLAWFNWRAAARPRSFLILMVPHMLQNLMAMLLMGM